MMKARESLANIQSYISRNCTKIDPKKKLAEMNRQIYSIYEIDEEETLGQNEETKEEVKEQILQKPSQSTVNLSALDEFRKQQADLRSKIHKKQITRARLVKYPKNSAVRRSLEK